MTVDEIKSWPKNEFGWHVSFRGTWIKLGDGVSLGNGSKFELQPIQIQGTKYLCYWYDNKGTLRIGFHMEHISKRVTDFEAIGKSHEYTDAHILEYKAYIDIFAKQWAEQNKISEVKE